MLAGVYIARVNSDLTEGKGSMRAVGYYDNEEAAVAAVKGWGVQGIGDGEVYHSPVWSSMPQGAKFKETLIYGYRENALGKWGYGFTDGRDNDLDDPDLKEYLRLKAKLGIS